MQKHSTWKWIPSLYFAEGLPYVVVMTIAVIMYKRLGLSNTDVALYTSWLYLPWVIKPFWSPVVDLFRTKRWWAIMMELVVGASMAGIAFTLHASGFVQWTMCFFWLMAFSSATHDIAVDGFYMLALDEHEQALNVGIRSTFYRISTIMGQGLLVMAAGQLETFIGHPRMAWSITMMIAATLVISLCLWHRYVLPHPESNHSTMAIGNIVRDFVDIFLDFLHKPHLIVAVLFLLTYRLPEALLVKITPLFMLDSIEQGGLGLTTAELGMVQGTIGVIGLIVGGILGGLAVARHGFQRWLWPMVLAMSIPNLLYVGLAYYQPEAIWVFSQDIVFDKVWIVGFCYLIEQFGYGFGFTAYMLYMLYFSQGPASTAHYAFCTGIMALSMMIPGMQAGAMQEHLGYYEFFCVVMALVPLTFVAASIIKVAPDFGKKHKTIE